MFIDILNKYFKPEGPSEIDRISVVNQKILDLVGHSKDYIKRLRKENERLKNEFNELVKKSKEKK